MSASERTIINIEIPNKYDIIPIHTSDRGTFKKCRRKWEWNSPSRRNLMRRVDVFGLTIPLWFGSGVHFALEQFYHPVLRHDPVESFLTWYNIQYHGGIVTQDWIPRVLDPKPVKLEDGKWKVKGLNILLPYEDHSEIEAHRELGEKMLKYYKDYSRRYDNFEVLATEHDFSVPIWDYANDCILKAIDVREESPNYGKNLEVHYRGRIDTVWVDEQDKHGIIDHKTTSHVGDDWLKSLDLDEQVTSYNWAAEVEAKYYGLPWADKAVDHTIYQALRKTYPKLPTILQNGMFSINRQTESVSWPTLKRVIELGGLQPLIDLDPKYQAYVEYVKEVGDEQFIIRKKVRRNRHQLISAGQRIYLEAMDMLSEPRIYPAMSAEWHCLNCPFRGPCIAMEDGQDAEFMLTNDYYSNRDR